MISTLQDRMERKKWMTTEEILDCIALAQSLPGVIACNMACFVGFKKKGLLGAIISDIAMVLPSFIIIVIVAAFLDTFEDNIYINGALMGIRAAATGLILFTTIKMAKQRMEMAPKRDKLFYALMMLLSFIVIAVFAISVVVVILSSIIVGIIYIKFMNDKLGEVKSDDLP